MVVREGIGLGQGQRQMLHSWGMARERGGQLLLLQAAAVGWGAVLGFSQGRLGVLRVGSGGPGRGVGGAMVNSGVATVPL